MTVESVIPCICADHEPDAGDSVYYGMPQLRVTNVCLSRRNKRVQFYEAYCPSCGRGGILQFKSAYLALKDWNDMQIIARSIKNIKHKHEGGTR